MASQKFFICRHCGNLVGVVENHNVPLVCCGEKMQELIPNTVEASVEKHLPDISFDKDKMIVKVGSQPHPMLEEHNISFIYVQTGNGGQRKKLNIGDQPEAAFSFVDDKAVAVFAYCNLHGLWKVEL